MGVGFLPDWNSLESVRATNQFLELTGLVLFGALVVLDVFAHLTEEGNPARSKELTKLGLVCFALAVLAELVAWPYSRRNDSLSDERDRNRGLQIQFLDQKAKLATSDASDAVKGARKAMSESAAAGTFASQAKNDAQAAATTSRQARQEADLIQNDIAGAKRELEQLRSPRRLTSVDKLTAKLGAFSGTEYTFSGTVEDEESIQLLRGIDDVLQRARWKRAPPPPRQGMMIDVFPDTDLKYFVPLRAMEGIRITVDAPEKIDLASVRMDNLPPWVRAAAALNLALASSLFPPEGDPEHPYKVTVAVGTSKAVRISVGKKPYDYSLTSESTIRSGARK